MTTHFSQLLSRSVEQLVPADELEQKLAAGASLNEPLRIKHGIDPTGSRIHLGHAVVLWKLREFQEMGHKIVLIVGDFTGMIGDTSDKQSMRQPLTRAQIEENMKEYLAQFARILDMSKVELRYNREWLSKLDFGKILELTQLFTVAQMIERENFWNRFTEKKPIGLHEFLYPIMQGYDSLAIEADVELGGSDQLFNMMAGRKIQEAAGMKPQVVLTTKLLIGLDGRKMSKSWGNCIYVTDTPTDQFGKVMSMRDESLVEYFTLATDVDEVRIKQVEADLRAGANPRDVKMQLAWEIVRRYHGESAADAARDEFVKVFSKGGVPDEIETVHVGADEIGVVDLLVQVKIAPSRGEAKRLVTQGAVTVDEVVITDIAARVRLDKKILLKVGKRRFVYVER